MSKLQAIRGMNDVLPPDSAIWQTVESTAGDLLRRYGYKQIRLPIVEPTELFTRAIGETTDIVEKEMYTFSDRNGDSLTLRPEGTAGTVRAGLQHGLLHNQSQRLWYVGPMFRHERPQRGRYRQFHQIGVETFGIEGPDIDAELLLLSRDILAEIGVGNLRLELNSLGTAEERVNYREALVAYFSHHVSDIDEDSQRRLERNPLRILDSKDKATQDIVANAPALSEFLGAASTEHFNELTRILEQVGVDFVLNPRLVRGLDYYGRTVFEWITEDLGAQGTVCAGGRYDGLVAQSGGRATPAIGFAMGLERLIDLIREQDRHQERNPHIYLISLNDPAAGLAEATRLRAALPGTIVETHCGGGSLKSRFKRADKSGAAVAVLLGGDEAERGLVSVKPLRGQAEQHTVEQAELVRHLRELVAAGAN